MKLPLFFALQIADAITTLVGIRLGGTEQSPFIAWLMRTTDPVTALLLAKMIGFALAAYAVWTRRLRVLTAVNVIFGVVVVWNVAQLWKVI